jgi:hypothetical protein
MSDRTIPLLVLFHGELLRLFVILFLDVCGSFLASAHAGVRSHVLHVEHIPMLVKEQFHLTDISVCIVSLYLKTEAMSSIKSCVLFIL